MGFLSNKRRKSDHTDYPVSVLDRPFVGEKIQTLRIAVSAKFTQVRAQSSSTPDKTLRNRTCDGSAILLSGAVLREWLLAAKALEEKSHS